VSASDESADDVIDAPPSRSNDLMLGVRFAVAVALTPLACTENDVPSEPSSDVLNGTRANSPPLVPPATHTDDPVSPVITCPNDSDVAELAQSVLAICVAVAVALATSVPPRAVAVTSTAPAVPPSVSCVDAVPFASVTAVVGDNVPLPEVTVSVTVTPDTGALDALVTSNTIGDASVLPTEPL
jgi:hypothetical protein